MKIKLNRGPLKNKYFDVPESTYRYEVRKMPDMWEMYRASTEPPDPFNLPEPQRGDYQKSNVTLKNGARVFEWMGWRE